MTDLVVKTVAPHIAPGIARFLSHVSSSTSMSEESKITYLDPFCSAVKIGILHFKTPNCKLGIKQNTIDIQAPTHFQGLHRYMNGDERDQLYQLKLPILYLRGLELGHLSPENFKVEVKYVGYLSQLLVQGLRKLQKTYEKSHKAESMIKNCLDGYINILTNPLPLEEFKYQTSQVANSVTMFVIYNEFLKKWRTDDIQVIALLCGYAEKSAHETYRDKIADSVDAFIMAKDLEIDALRPG
jgi:hypothetical protein